MTPSEDSARRPPSPGDVGCWGGFELVSTEYAEQPARPVTGTVHRDAEGRLWFTPDGSQYP